MVEVDWDWLDGASPEPAARARKLLDAGLVDELAVIERVWEELGPGPGKDYPLAAAVTALRRGRMRAEWGVIPDGRVPCACYLADRSGKLHRKRGEHVDCYPSGSFRDHLRSWKRGRELVAVTYEPYGALDDSIITLADAVAADGLVVTACVCCTTHYPGKTTSVRITRAGDPFGGEHLGSFYGMVLDLRQPRTPDQTTPPPPS